MRLKDLKIGLRLGIVLSFIILFSFASLAFFVFHKEKITLIERTKLRMYSQLDDLLQIIELQVKKNQEYVNLSLKTADLLFTREGEIHEDKANFIEIEAINQDTKLSTHVKVPAWKIKGKNLQYSTNLVDKIVDFAGGTATIFQKIPQGYLRIATNVRKNDGNRAVGTYIPMTSEVVQTIEAGRIYRGRAFVVDDWYLTAYMPILVDGEIKGMLYFGIKEKDMKGLKELFYRKRFFKNGYPYVVDSKGVLTIHPHIEGENMEETDFFSVMQNSKHEKVEFRYEWLVNGEEKWKYQYFQYCQVIDSYVALTVNEEDLFAVLQEIKNSIIFATVIAIVLVIIIVSYTSRTITGGIKHAVNFAERIAEGDLSETLEIDQKDEVGVLSSALNNMLMKLREVADLANMLAAGRFTEARQRVNSDSAGEMMNAMQQMVEKLNKGVALSKSLTEGNLTVVFDENSQSELDAAMREMTIRLRNVVDTIKTGAENISSAGEQLTSASYHISEGATQQAAAAEQVSSSMDEMVASITQNTENANFAQQIALEIEQEIQESKRLSDSTTQNMKLISEKIGMISEIANKTDMLALNAAIEAAKAGKFGKGFTVVANEIRKLAEHSNRAAIEIIDLVGISLRSAQDSGSMLEKLVPNIQRNARLVQEVATASIEQDSGSKQVNQAIQELNGTVQKNALTAEQLAANAKGLSEQNNLLLESVRFFKLTAEDNRVSDIENSVLRSVRQAFKGIDNSGEFDVVIRPKNKENEDDENDSFHNLNDDEFVV